MASPKCPECDGTGEVPDSLENYSYSPYGMAPCPSCASATAVTPVTSVPDELARAAAALESDEPGAALEALLVAWREKRHPRLADLIDHVSIEAGATLPSLVAKPLAAQWKQWRAVAEGQSPADFERLVAVPMPRKWTDAQPMIELLFAWPHDPRFARFLARLVAENTFAPKPRDPRSHDVAHFYFRITTRLVQLADSRAQSALENRTGRPVGGYLASWRERLPERAAELAAIPIPTLTSDETALLATLEARYAADQPKPGDAETGARLRADIYARPDDVSLRAPYADWLTERGDPLGDFITLQLAHERMDARRLSAARVREAKLLAQHGRIWAGVLDAVFEADGRLFESGVFAGGTLATAVRELAPETLADPMWRAIRVLDVPLHFPTSILFHENLAWVRSLKLTEASALQLQVGGKSAAPFAPTLEELHLEHWGDNLGPIPHRHPFATTEAFPKLRVLGVHDVPWSRATAARAWLPHAPVLERLERLELGVYPAFFEPWWEPLNRSPLKSVMILGKRRLAQREDWEHTLARDHRGNLGRLHSRYHHRPGAHATLIEYGMASLLETLSPETLTEVVIEKSTSTQKLNRERIAAALARFPGLVTVTLPWS